MKLHAVSSLKIDDTDPNYTMLELTAFKSWVPIFDSICLVNEEHEAFQTPRTRFVNGEDPPTIKQLTEEAAKNDGITVLLNGDIWLAPSFRFTIEHVSSSGRDCGLSNRYNYNPDVMDIHNAQFHPGGLDLFFASQDIWRRVSQDIPEVFRIGITIWDAWMMNFLPGMFPERFTSITDNRVMAHPLIQNRTINANSTHDTTKSRLSAEVGKWYEQHKTTDPVMTWRPGVTL